MFFLIYGEDSFRARRALQAAQAKFRETRDVSGFNVIRLRAADGLNRVRDELFAVPFLAEKKLVVMDGFCSIAKAEQEELVDSIGRKPDSTVAIFFEEASAKSLAKSPLFTLLQQQKFTAEHRALTPAEASRFATAEAQAAGSSYQTTALRKLIEAVGTDSWRIHQETQKLAALAASQGRPKIEPEDVESMVSGSQEQTVFKYLDACTAGKQRPAVAALDRLLESGESELMVIAMLQRHFRTLMMAGDLKRRGLNEATAAKQLGVHPFAAKKAWRAADKFSLAFLHDCLQQLADLEEALKSGRTRPRVGLDIFTHRLLKQTC
jgi:DNA polymerase-3 subunit delta